MTGEPRTGAAGGPATARNRERAVTGQPAGVDGPPALGGSGAGSVPWPAAGRRCAPGDRSRSRGRSRSRVGRLLVAVVLPAVVLLPATAVGAARLAAPELAGRQATCRGEPAVVITDEFWGGTAERDVVVASAADVAELWGGLDDDLICIHPDPNAPYHGMVVSGGPGNDTIVTYGGANDVYGDGDDDILYLNGAGEYADGGTGNDHVWGLGADDVSIQGGDGTDVLQGSPAGDLIAGGAGGDLLIGAGGADILTGDGGNDTLQGGGGADDLAGGSGPDSCQDAPGSTFTGCESIVDGGPPGGLAG
jgi:hypothetical protein